MTDRRASGRSRRPLFATIAAGVASLGAIAGCASDAGRATTPTEPSAALEATAIASAFDLRSVGCRAEPVRGAGSMIAAADGSRYLLTAAHVVAGSTSITIRPASSTEDDVAAVAAVVVALDPVADVALLRADVDLPPLVVADLIEGDRGVAVVFRDGVTTLRPFTIVNPAIVEILDIYGEAEVERTGYRVEIAIAPGDSGAVLVGEDGRAGGVLYARTRSTRENAFATNTSTLPDLLAAAEAAPAGGIATGECP